MGLLSSIVGALSPTERRLLVILGMIASKKVKTRAEREIGDYVEQEGARVGKSSRERLEKLAMDKNVQSEIINQLGLMNAKGLTKGQILAKVEEYRQKQIQKMSTSGIAQTNAPDQQEFAVYSCPTCGFTVDAEKAVPPSKLKCPLCETTMRGLRREEFHEKNNAKGFNQVDEAADMPEPPKVKP